MIIQVDIGGVLIHFGTPFAPVKPEPFYPFLLSVGSMQDNVGEETGNAQFLLHLKAQPLIWINLRRKVVMFTDEMVPIFEGYIGRVSYNQGINVTVET